MGSGSAVTGCQNVAVQLLPHGLLLSKIFVTKILENYSFPSYHEWAPVIELLYRATESSVDYGICM